MFLNDMIEKAKREKEKRKKRETAKNVAKGLTAGAILGSLAGLLFAPKSGKETRKEIADKTTEAVGVVKQTLNESGEEIKNKIDKLEKNFGEAVGHVKETITEIKEKKLSGKKQVKEAEDREKQED